MLALAFAVWYAAVLQPGGLFPGPLIDSFWLVALVDVNQQS